MVSYVAWHLGPVLERWLFVVTNPATGEQVADFRLWWPAVTTEFRTAQFAGGGIHDGVCRHPDHFTITEDALSSVPPARTKSGSLALGASRWQTAIRVVLPTASAGVFSADDWPRTGCRRDDDCPHGDWQYPHHGFNTFSGMRTLSANIAVELPEAPHHGTLYRTLFLGGMVLFLMTFLMNTLAEILRQHLRALQNCVMESRKPASHPPLQQPHMNTGEPFVWGTAMGLAVGLVMIVYLLGSSWSVALTLFGQSASLASISVQRAQPGCMMRRP